MTMKLFKCRTGKFVRRTILVTIFFLFINATLFTLKCCFLKNNDDNVRSNDVAQNNARKIHQLSSNRSVSSDIRDKISFRNSHWQVHKSFANSNARCSKITANYQNKKACVKSNFEEVVAYSSFYDDRPTPVSPRWVQVLGVIAIVPKPSIVHCQIWLKENVSQLYESNSIVSKAISIGYNASHKTKGIVVVKNVKLKGSTEMSWFIEIPAVSYTTGRNHNLGNVVYGQRQYACPLKDVHPSLFPTHVSLVFKPGEESTIFLPVQYPLENKIKQENNTKYQHEFVVCVTQAYGRIDASELIEWMEIHKILGVTKINIYNGTLLPDERLDSVLNHYIKTGLLSFYQIPPAVAHFNKSKAIEATKLSSPASLNDCMMRHVKSARWIIIVDFDEIILPVNADDYHSLMEQLLEVVRRPSTTKKSNTKTTPSLGKVTNLSHSKSILVSGKQDNNQSYMNNDSSSIKQQKQHHLTKRSLNNSSNASNNNNINNNNNNNSSIPTTSSPITDDLPHTFVFRMAYFFRDLANVTTNVTTNATTNATTNETDTESPPSLFSSKYRWRTKTLDGMLGAKSFINPRHCLSVFNHYCYITWSGKQKKFSIPPELAFVRHYRESCSLSKDRCQSITASIKQDDGVDRFENRLIDQVEKVKRKIFE